MLIYVITTNQKLFLKNYFITSRFPPKMWSNINITPHFCSYSSVYSLICQTIKCQNDGSVVFIRPQLLTFELASEGGLSVQPQCIMGTSVSVLYIRLNCFLQNCTSPKSAVNLNEQRRGWCCTTVAHTPTHFMNRLETRG